VLNVTANPFMLSVVILNVVMLSVVAPYLGSVCPIKKVVRACSIDNLKIRHVDTFSKYCARAFKLFCLIIYLQGLCISKVCFCIYG